MQRKASIKLSEEEQTLEYRYIFDVYLEQSNETESGKLPAPFTVKALRGAGLCLTDKDAQDIEMDLDIDNDSVCKFEEFVRLTKVYAKQAPSAQELEEAFQALDEDGSGSIGTQELTRVLGALGAHFTETESAHFIKAADNNGDGEVDLNEFVSLMTTPLVDKHSRFLSGPGSLQGTSGV